MNELMVNISAALNRALDLVLDLKRRHYTVILHNKCRCPTKIEPRSNRIPDANPIEDGTGAGLGPPS